MINNQYNFKPTGDPEIDSLIEEINELIFHNDIFELKKKIKNVQKNLNSKSLSSDSKQTLVSVLDACLLMTIPLQSESVVIKLLNTAILASYKIQNFDWKEKIDGYIIRIPSLEDRDKVKSRFITALTSNVESVVSGSSQKTIGQWVNEYHTKSRDSKDTSLTFVEISNSSDFNKLNDEIKEILKNLFKLVNYLKLSSERMESDTESISIDLDEPGVYLEYKAGEVDIVDLSDELNSLINKNNVANLLPISDTNSDFNKAPKLQENITSDQLNVIKKSEYDASVTNSSVDARQKLNSNQEFNSRILMPDISLEVAKLINSKINVSLLSNQIQQAISHKNILSSLTYLRFLAENSRLYSLSNDNFFTKLLLAKSQRESNIRISVSLSDDPDHIYQLRSILLLILVDQLNLGESEAAHIASDLIAIARDKGEKIEHVSYFDENDGQYHWL